jgi:hypothetical protein
MIDSARHPITGGRGGGRGAAGEERRKRVRASLSRMYTR